MKLHYKVSIKNDEDKNDSRLKIIRPFLELCLNTPYKEGQRPTLERALDELAGKGTTTIKNKIFTVKDVFGNAIQDFQCSRWFKITSKLEYENGK